LSNLDKKFAKLGLDNAPGQEVRQQMDVPDLQGPELGGTPVDFSHGDVNAFPPIPGSLQTFIEGFEEGAEQAYTEYRGRQLLRESLAQKLAKFSGAEIDSEREFGTRAHTDTGNTRCSIPGHGSKHEQRR